MTIEKILVPDIGNFDSVDVIEIIAKIGDAIKKDDLKVNEEKKTEKAADKKDDVKVNEEK